MHDVQSAWVYMLRCSDGSFYVGSHRGPDVDVRVGQHAVGHGGDYTRRRLPVVLVWNEAFQFITDAIAVERQLKGWSRAKKQALIDGDWTLLAALAKRRAGRAPPSRPPSAAPQDEETTVRTAQPESDRDH